MIARDLAFYAICGMTGAEPVSARISAMKVTVDVNCSPAEARAFLGLPDLTPLHDKYIQTVLDSVTGAGSLDQVESLMKSMSPMGDAGIRMFKQMMDLGMATGGMGTTKDKKSD
jgi:hypothetical protein